MDPVIVLCGGFGTRLRSVVADKPKPLALIDGRPFLAFLLDRLIHQGVERILLSLHHEAQQVVDFLDAYRLECFGSVALESYTEPKPLGTGGAVRYVAKSAGLLDGSFFVMNGDTFLRAGVAELMARPSPAIGLVEVPNAGRFGSVETDKIGGAVQRFNEKGAEGPGWIYSGLCRLDAAHVLDRGTAEDSEYFSLEQDVFPELIKRRALTSTQLSGAFIDIGVPEDYRRFEAEASSLRAQ